MRPDVETKHDQFITPQYLAQAQARAMEPPRGRLLIAGCRSGAYLSRKVVERYKQLLAESGAAPHVLYLENIDRRFSDSEAGVRLDTHVGGTDVFLFQALFDPTSEIAIDQNYMAFLIATRAFREHGVRRITGVLPYLAYARQDKPTKFTREPTTARLMAELAITAGMDQLIVWNPHYGQFRGFYSGVTVNVLESLTLFMRAFEQFRGRKDVIAVAPDAGASKFVTHFGRALDLNCAIASKFRPRPEVSTISEIIGDFAGKKVAIVLDDMMRGGWTMYALVKKLVEEKGIEEVYIGASHNLCVGQAGERLSELHDRYKLKQVIVTNSIPQTEVFTSLPVVSIKCLSDPLARTINRIHYGYSVSEVFYRPPEG